MEGGSPTRGGLKTVDITTFFPTIKMLAISQADNLVYYWNLSSWASVSGGGGGTPTLTATQIAFGDGSNAMSSSSALTFVSNTLGIIKATQGPIITLNNGVSSNYIEFSRTGFTEKGSVGALGGFEMNFSYNMDYADDVHRYYDSTKAAVWMALFNGGWQVQFAPSGSTPDIWNNTGRKLMLYQTIDGHMVLNTDATTVAATTYAAILTVPRAVSGVSIAGDTSLIIEGNKVLNTAGDIFLNTYNAGNVYLCNGASQGNVSIGTAFLAAKLYVAGNVRFDTADFKILNLPEYANRTAALAGGLGTGSHYTLPISGDNKVVCAV